MQFCFFKYWYICALHPIFFEIFVSEVRYFIYQIVVVVQSIWHSLSLRNYLLVQARRIRAIVLWAKPFDCEKLNKIDFKLFCSCFQHLCILVFRYAKIWQTAETYSPQTSSITAAVAAPAVVICLNSLFCPKEVSRCACLLMTECKGSFKIHLSVALAKGCKWFTFLDVRA